MITNNVSHFIQRSQKTNHKNGRVSSLHQTSTNTVLATYVPLLVKEGKKKENEISGQMPKAI